MPTPDDLLAALDPEQRQVAEALRGPVRVLAGAGTGKTRAITHRMAYGVATGVYAPTEVLAVTFTTRAAGEMRTRLRHLGAGGVQARTFHSAALRQLRYFWPRKHGVDLPTLTESKIGMIAGAARRLRVESDQALLRDLAAEIEWAKVSNVGPDTYAAVAPGRGRSVSGQTHETVARVFEGYEQVKRDQGRMDMEDVLLLTAGLLAEDERVAAQVRGQYKWFVVDEFQDVSPIQSALLDLWLGGRHELCVVGDPAQTIYSFAGANARYLHDFVGKHPGAVSLELVRNYRSTPEVVTAANALLDGTPSKGVDLRAQRPSGPAATFTAHPDEVAEAAAVAERIVALRAQGVPLGEMAVLFRINAQSQNLEEALAKRGLSYVVRGAARFFERQEVRQAVTLLRGAARSGQGTDDVTADVRDTLAGLGWSPDAPTTRGQTRDRWESWQALVDQAVEYATAQPGADLGAFVDELDRRAAEQHAPGRRRRHAGHPARRQGPGVGRRLPVRAPGGHPADHLRRGAGRGRGGAAAALRRHDPRPPPSRAVLGAGPQPRWPRVPQAQPVPRRAAARRRGGRDERRGRPRQPAPRCGHLSRVRQAAQHRRGEEDRPLRGLPGVVRRGALRASARVAAGARRRRQGARVRGVHRRDAAADRRAPADHGGRPAGHQRHRPVQARAVRRAGAERGRRAFLKFPAK